MMHEALSLLGLAARARKVADGEFKALEAIKKKKACLILLAKDASENTAKKFRDKAAYAKIPVMECASMELLGRAIGKDDRAVIALLDRGFGEALQAKLQDAPLE